MAANACRSGSGSGRGANGLRDVRGHLGVERVRLGQVTDGLGEVADLAWADDSDGETGGRKPDLSDFVENAVKLLAEAKRARQVDGQTRR